MTTPHASRLTPHASRLTPHFVVPEDDQGDFNALPDDVRADVDRLLIGFEVVHGAGKVNPALKKFSALHCHRRGYAFASLRRKYYAYVKCGDWRCLVDNARLSRQQRPADERDNNLPKDFIEFLKGLFQSNQRHSEPAIRLLYRQWRAGESIPGYGTWQEWFLDTHPMYPLPEGCPPDLPRGWSKANLRRYIPEEAELALARRGVSAARHHLPDVITTRDGLRPLELVMFDDVRTDFKILVAGYPQPVQLNLLVALDVATGMILRFGCRPEITREDGMRDKLKLRDMKCLVAGILLQYGIPRKYEMILKVENVTAAIPSGMELALREISGKGIAVSRTMMIHGTAIWGGYKDKALGNPRGKAALESTFNLLHNEAGFLPGQIGRRYDAGPAELAGRERENADLEKIGRFLTPHQRAALKRPFLNVTEARVVLTDLFNRLIRRDDHCMEGFLPVAEWRTEKFQQWRQEADLLLPEFSGLRPDADIIWRTPARLESPLERWARLVEQVGGPAAFRRFHPGAIMRLYDEQKQVTIDNSEIVFRFQKETFVYRIANVQNARRPLQNEMTALVYFDAQDMSMIHLTDGEGAYLGSIPRTRGARRLDKEAMQVQFNASREAMRQLQQRVSSRMPQVAEQHLADLQANQAVIEDAVKDMDANNLVPDAGTGGQVAPQFAADIARAKLAAQVAERQEAVRQRAIRHYRGDVGELAEMPERETPTAADTAAPVADLAATAEPAPEPGADDLSADALL